MMSRKAIDRGIHITISILLWLGTLVVFVPVFILIITSLKNTKEAKIIGLTLPETLQFENFAIVWEKGLIVQGFVNSLLIAVPCVLLIVFASALMSYYLARRNARSTYPMYVFVVAGIIKPIPLVTTFLLLQQLHLLNTRAGVMLVLAGTLISLATFVYVGFIKGIPRELDDAAAIDGCGPFRTFWTIIFPLLKPCTFTIVILMLLNVWNDGQAALFFLGNSDYWTMPLNIYRFFGYFRTEWNYVFGCIILMTLPVFITYLFGQRYIIDGMVAGSVKG